MSPSRAVPTSSNPFRASPVAQDNDNNSDDDSGSGSEYDSTHEVTV
jgi:hypothetical protein